MVQPSKIVTLAGKCTNKLKLLDRLLAVYLRLRYQELVNHKLVVNLLILKSVGLQCRLVVRLWIPTRISFIIYAIIFLSLLLTTTPINYNYRATVSVSFQQHYDIVLFL